MSRNAWRVTLVMLCVLAVAGLFVFTSLGLWKTIFAAPPSPFEMFSTRRAMESGFSRAPGWLSSIASLLTLFLVGAAGLYLLPDRMSGMRRALTVSWARLFQILLAGLTFQLLGAALIFAASLARLTFPISLLAAFSLFFLSTWGYLAMAYCLGAELLRRAAWGASPLAALFLGLLLFQPLVHVPYLQIPIILVLGGIGLGTVITTRFGTNEGWSLNPLSEA